MATSIAELAQQLGAQLLARNLKVATAESCTGGAIAAAITSVAGSSAWFEYGLVSYSNSAKQQLLAVPGQLLEQQGAVSEPVVLQMVLGALQVSGAQLAVAVSGIAGPGGGSAEKPVGSVWLAWGGLGAQAQARLYHFAGDRLRVQQQAVECALQGLLEYLQKNTV